MRSVARPAAAFLALVGTVVLAWVAATLVWGEPFTAVAAARAQAGLRAELAATGRIDPSLPLKKRASTFRRGLRQGDAFGRIVIPKLHLRSVVVQGTSRHDLTRGPGHYRITSMPGLGGTVAIAGHRTTYLRPFRHIDRLRAGDRVYLQMPYGTFRYVVYARRIVDDRDWSIIRRRGWEKLVLSACHPLYSASHRIVVFARLEAAPRLR
ncbi:MAG TPA: class E sortase [Gaiellaceae bacterium]|nr:class E sortase [Gaiellaceae bacterium]